MRDPMETAVADGVEITPIAIDTRRRPPDVSPYLQRPLRSLEEVLRARNRSRDRAQTLTVFT